MLVKSISHIADICWTINCLGLHSTKLWQLSSCGQCTLSFWDTNNLIYLLWDNNSKCNFKHFLNISWMIWNLIFQRCHFDSFSAKQILFPLKWWNIIDWHNKCPCNDRHNVHCIVIHNYCPHCFFCPLVEMPIG